MSDDEKPQRDESGYFLPGNTIWKDRGDNVGGRVSEMTADILEDNLYKYIQWNNDNPIVVAEAIKYEGRGRLMKVPKERPLSVLGFCNNMRIMESTWYGWKEDRADLKKVISVAEQIFQQHKIDGASAGIFNASIISRLLGLADKQQVDTKVDGLEQLLKEIRARK